MSKKEPFNFSFRSLKFEALKTPGLNTRLVSGLCDGSINFEAIQREANGPWRAFHYVGVPRKEWASKDFPSKEACIAYLQGVFEDFVFREWLFKHYPPKWESSTKEPDEGDVVDI